MKAKDIMESCVGNENGVIDQVNWDGGMGGWYDMIEVLPIEIMGFVRW